MPFQHLKFQKKIWGGPQNPHLREGIPLPNHPRASHIGLEILAKIHLLETRIRFRTRHPIFGVFQVHVFIANYIAIIQVIFHVI